MDKPKITEQQTAKWVKQYGPDLGHWYTSDDRCSNCDCRPWGRHSKVPCGVNRDDYAPDENALPFEVSARIWMLAQEIANS